MDATSRSKATQRKGVAAGERKARKAGLAEEVQPLGAECCGRCFEKWPYLGVSENVVYP